MFVSEFWFTYSDNNYFDAYRSARIRKGIGEP